MRGIQASAEKSRRPSSRRHGMALVEVLLAIAIISISLGVSMQTLALCTRLESRSVKLAKGRGLAEEKLLDLRVSGAGLTDGETSGRFSAPFDAYRWVARKRSASGTPPLTYMDLLIYQSEGRTPLFRTSTLLMQGGA